MGLVWIRNLFNSNNFNGDVVIKLDPIGDLRLLISLILGNNAEAKGNMWSDNHMHYPSQGPLSCL